MTAFGISSLALAFHDPKSYSVNSLKLSFANNTPDAFEYSDTATCLDTMVGLCQQPPHIQALADGLREVGASSFTLAR